MTSKNHDVIIEQKATDMKNMSQCILRFKNLRLHANGVFSNVYRGTLITNKGNREIAVKKTWTYNRERNFEFTFLTGQNRTRHDNIVQMLYSFSNKTKDKLICESFVFDYMPDTLDSLITSKSLDITDIKLYTWQLFNGLLYLFSHNIVHRDIKPINTLVNHETGNLKIGDFGSAKVLSDPLKKSTSYQVTRFYRPPELLFCHNLFSLHLYNHKVDIWSAGCIVGEMLRGKVLFPGRDSVHQLKIICGILGTPTKWDLEQMLVPILIKEERKGDGLKSILPRNTPVDAIDMLKKILVYTPNARLHGKDLLEHDFLKSIFRNGACRSNGQVIKDILSKKGDCGETTSMSVKEQEDFCKSVTSVKLTSSSEKNVSISKNNAHADLKVPRIATSLKNLSLK